MKVPYVSSKDDLSLEINVKEHVIWENKVTAGFPRRNVIETQILTNLRVLQNNSSYFLHTLDDIVVMNQHRESQHRRHGNYPPRLGISYRTGTKMTIGDVVFIFQGKPVIAFKQIVDPHGVSGLAKNARRNLVSLLKTAEKNSNPTKVQNKDLKISRRLSPYPMNRTHYESLVSNILKCSKCGASLVRDSNFCISCGSKLSFLCSNCNHTNPPGSAFCNNCGFALT